MKLLADRILVKMDNPEQKTASGIILPEAKQNKDTGIIVSVGPRVSSLKIGDKISKFTQVAGIPYEENGENYLILREKSEIEMVL